MTRDSRSFPALYARNQAAAEAAQASDDVDTCATITLRELLAADLTYSGGDLALPGPTGRDTQADSFAFDRNVADLGGQADPNQPIPR